MSLARSPEGMNWSDGLPITAIHRLERICPVAKTVSVWTGVRTMCEVQPPPVPARYTVESGLNPTSTARSAPSRRSLQ